MFASTADKKLQDSIEFVLSFYDKFIDQIEKAPEFKQGSAVKLKGKDGADLTVSIMGILKKDFSNIVECVGGKAVVLDTTKISCGEPYDAAGIKSMILSCYQIRCRPNFVIIETYMSGDVIRKELLSIQKDSNGRIYPPDWQNAWMNTGLRTPHDARTLLPESRRLAIPEEAAAYLNQLVDAMKLQINPAKDAQNETSQRINANRVG